MKRAALGLVLGVTGIGCGDGSAEQAAAPAVVTRRDAEPPGPHCAHGGAAIGGTMQFMDMPQVTDLSGLRAVRSVGGDVTFLNDALSDDQVAAFLHQIGR